MVEQSISTYDDIIGKMPHKAPFLFIDCITSVSRQKIEGNFFLKREMNFYQGHYPDHPITPGVILTEIMAQIGLVAFGIYLLEQENEEGHTISYSDKIPVLSTTEMEFKKIVEPEQTVYVASEKILFKHGKLICKTIMRNASGEILARGTLSGFLFTKDKQS